MSPGRSRKKPSKAELYALWGANIRARRDVLGLRQEGLAEASGVPQQTISRVENGVTRPSIELLLKLAAALHAEPADLFPWPTYLALSGEKAVSVRVIGDSSSVAATLLERAGVIAS